METTKEIKQYKSLVWVEVAFGPQIERLYFEGTEDLLKNRMQHDYVYFAIHNRHVASSKIKDFGKVDDPKKLGREWRISHLTETQKSEVKELANKMLKNIGRDPTDSEFNSMIKRVVNGEEENEIFKEIQISKIERFRKGQISRKQRIAKIVTGSYIGFKD